MKIWHMRPQLWIFHDIENILWGTTHEECTQKYMICYKALSIMTMAALHGVETLPQGYEHQRSLQEDRVPYLENQSSDMKYSPVRLTGVRLHKLQSQPIQQGLTI